jgi:polyisoprenoid-binding protein YceI
MLKKGLLTLTTAVWASVAAAAPQSFDFKDPKGVNNAVFVLDAPLEAINGTASGISGTVDYDPDNPASLSGTITVDAKSLTVPNPVMQEHLHGEQWLNVTQFPVITFTSARVDKVQHSGNKVTAEVTGTMTIRGQSREITAPVSFTYLKDKLGARTNGQMEGDLLVMRSKFSIRRSDFGINPGAPADKVAETIDLTLSLAGAAPER